MQREKWIEDAAEVVAESALYSARDNGSAPDRAYRDASMHADSDQVVLGFIEADMRLSSRLGSGDVSDDLLREVRRLAVKTLDAGSTDPRKIKSSPALSGYQHTGATMNTATFIEAVLTSEAPDLRAWIEAHADEVRAACLDAAPKLKAPMPASFGTPRRLAQIPHLRYSWDAKTSVWVDDAGSWIMQTGADRYLLQPWGITLSREEVMALPGLWREAQHYGAAGDATGDLVIILDIGDGHGPLPRFAHADGRHATVKIGRRRWTAYPSDKQPGYLARLAIGGSAMLFENGDAWDLTEVTPALRPASAPIRLTGQQRRDVDEVVVCAISGSSPRAQRDIVEMLTDIGSRSGVRSRWADLDIGIADNRHAWNSATAEKLVRASLERLERAGRAMKVKEGWLRT